MISEYTQMDYIDGTKVHVCLTKANTFWPIAFFVAIIGAFFVVPLFVLVVLYTVIAAHLMADPGTSCTDSACNQRARRQVVLMLATVVLSFFVCLLPFRVFTMWIILAPEHAFLDLGLKRYYITLYASRVMVYLNSAVNPILYNLMSSKFRRGFCRLCRSRCDRAADDDDGCYDPDVPPGVGGGGDGYGYGGADGPGGGGGGGGRRGIGRRRRRHRRRRRDVFRLRHTGTLTTTLSVSCNGPPTAAATVTTVADGDAEVAVGNGTARSRGTAAAVGAAAAAVAALLGRRRRRRRVNTRLVGRDDDDDDDHLKESFV